MFFFLWPACSFQASPGRSVPRDFGGHSEGETPLPIPNRAVKPLSADGTWWATAWESRTPPVFFVAVLRGGSLLRRSRPLQTISCSRPGEPCARLFGRRRGGPGRAPPIRRRDHCSSRRRAAHTARPRVLARGRTRRGLRSRSPDRQLRRAGRALVACRTSVRQARDGPGRRPGGATVLAFRAQRPRRPKLCAAGATAARSRARMAARRASARELSSRPVSRSADVSIRLTSARG